jgi:hypothetical protein
VRGILTNSQDLRSECPVTLSLQKQKELLEEIYPDGYIWEYIENCGSYTVCYLTQLGHWKLSCACSRRLSWILPGMLRRT